MLSLILLCFVNVCDSKWFWTFWWVSSYVEFLLKLTCHGFPNLKMFHIFKKIFRMRCGWMKGFFKLSKFIPDNLLYFCLCLPSRPLKFLHIQMASMRQWKYSKNMLRCVEVWWWKAVCFTCCISFSFSKLYSLSCSNNLLPFSLFHTLHLLLLNCTLYSRWTSKSLHVIRRGHIVNESEKNDIQMKAEVEGRWWIM